MPVSGASYNKLHTRDSGQGAPLESLINGRYSDTAAWTCFVGSNESEREDRYTP